jgi:hypothetical protein
MRDEVLRDLLAKLDQCAADAGAKNEFRRMIEAVGNAHGITLEGPAERIAFARRLLDAGSPRTEIRDRLMARFNVGRSQAYGDISDALQIVQSLTILLDVVQV